MTDPSFAERLYQVLLTTYPRAFRERYGDELLTVFRAQRSEAEYRGFVGGLRFAKDVAWDWVTTTPRAWRQERGRTRALGERPWQRKENQQGGVVVEALRQDVGFAVRSLLRAPAFTLVAGLTLAIGIGSTAAVFGVVKSVLWAPLPYGEPDRVVTIWSSWNAFPKTWVSQNEYQTYLTQTRGFEDLATWNETNVSFTDPANPERVGAVVATENLVDVLGVGLQHGRYFTTDEAMRSDSLPADVVVISHEVFVRRWNADPGVVGTTAEINGRQREIIGVLPPGFRMPTQFGTLDKADIYFPRYVPRVPVTNYPGLGGSHGDHVVGRLRPGVTVDQARLEVEGAIAQVHAEFGAYPPERAFRPLVFSAEDDVLGSIRPALLALLATVGFVLLIACANVANLMLARSDDRAGELSVRAALGAGRRRLVVQLLVEAVVLALLGGAAGVLLAVGGVEAFKALNPGNLPRVADVALDAGVLGFALVTTVATAILFGVLPALRATRGDLRSRMGRRAERGVGRAGWQGTLVASEMALAVVLVVGAGLMVRTFEQLTSIEPGFDGTKTLTAAISLPTTRYPDAAASTLFYRELIRQVGEIPGVRSVGAIRSLPLASEIGDWGLDVEGYDESINPNAAGDWQIASPGYFETMGIPLVEGRTFDWSDEAESQLVGVVNETFVRMYLPNQQPIGRTFVMSGTTVTIVGVVGDVRHNGITGVIKAKFYIPVAQWGSVVGGNPTSLRLVVAASVPPEDLLTPVRDVVRGLDPSLAFAEAMTMEDVLEAAVAQPRFLVVIMGSFSLIAVLLALVGIYGVIAYGVGERTQEIGLRMALGAVQEEVVGLMVRQGAMMVAVGLAVGVALAFGLSRFLQSQLYGVTPTDPATYGVVVVGFALVAWFATYLPSRRAARVDPIRALKVD